VLGALAAAVGLLAAFVWWERRTDHPMLDLGFFRSRAFSVGTAVVSIAFFALLGGIFALTQYLQFAHGYSAIEAGAIMSPMALGLMAGAGSSSKAVARLGSARVVTIGMGGVVAMLALTVLMNPGTSALALIAWFLGLTVSMGWVMAPATDAVVGAVPAARSGVASATNTVARMVSGALGVAVIGSLVTSLYSSDLESAGVPEPAQESVGAASAIAAQLPVEAGARLTAVAGEAFSDAMGAGMLIAAGLAALGAVLAARLLRT
jgi:Flp pilus assembly protein TadG